MFLMSTMSPLERAKTTVSSPGEHLVSSPQEHLDETWADEDTAAEEVVTVPS